MNTNIREELKRLYGENMPREITLNEEIEKEFRDGIISDIERDIMYRQQNYISFNDILFHDHPEYQDKNDNFEYRTVNVPIILSALYNVHAFHPEMKINEKFAAALYFSSLDSKNVLKYIYYIIQYEENQTATFKTEIMTTLENIRSLLSGPNFFEPALANKKGEFAEFENGSIGMFEIYNELFKSKLGFDLFEGNNLYANLGSSRKR